MDTRQGMASIQKRGKVLNIEYLSVSDLRFILQLKDSGSLRMLCRKRGLNPATSSKALKRIEEKMGVRLFRRSPSGLRLSREALPIMSLVEKILGNVDRLLSSRHLGDDLEKKRVPITIVGLSYLNTAVVAPQIEKVQNLLPHSRFRLLDLLPEEMLTGGLQNLFELAIHLGSLNWPNTWVSEEIGTLSWGLFGQKIHPLGPKAKMEEIQKFPFIIPTYWSDGKFRVGDDLCPIPLDERIYGHEAPTATHAAILSRSSNQLAFIPKVVARPFVDSGELSEIKIINYPKVSRSVYLSANVDAVSKRLYEGSKALFRRVLL